MRFGEAGVRNRKRHGDADGESGALVRSTRFVAGRILSAPTDVPDREEWHEA
jgi:hypothetical protein